MDEDTRNKLYLWIDGVFLLIYLWQIIYHMILSRRFFQDPKLINLYNIIIIACVESCLGLRIGCLIKTIFVDRVVGKEDAFGISMYFTFYLPFDLLNFAVLTHFFQWIEGINALKRVYNFT
jgi:hypothetical protein